MPAPDQTRHPDSAGLTPTPLAKPSPDSVEDEKARTAVASNDSSVASHGTNEKATDAASPPPPGKKKWFGKDKVAKPADDEAPAVKPAGLFSLFRFATRGEIILNIIGLVVAAIAGAALPCMTIVFGRLVTLFTDYGTIVLQVANEGMTPETQVALDAAKAALKKECGNCALYLMAMGFAMFFLTYTYMLIWNYTSEAQSKRLREAYLRAVLRQEVSLRNARPGGG